MLAPAAAAPLEQVEELEQVEPLALVAFPVGMVAPEVAAAVVPQLTVARA
jgi:hypothetical protein